MSMLRPMRDELFKYRKRKSRSIDGSGSGVPYTSYSKSRRHVSGLPYVPRGSGHHHDLYNLDTPSEYDPNLNAPAVQPEEYWPSDNWDSHNIQHSTDPNLFRPFPELPATEETFSYQKSKSASEFFLKVMEVMYRPFEEGQEIPSLTDIWREHFKFYDDDMLEKEMDIEAAIESTPEDVNQKFIDIAGALNHLQNVFPEDHPDIVNLKGALHEILEDREAMSKSGSLVGESGDDDPYEIDAFEEAERVYEQKMQSLESKFEEPMFEPVESQVPEMFEEGPGMFEQQPDEAFMEVDSLEQIVEQEALYETPPPEFMESEIMPVEMESDMNMPSLMPGLTVFDIDPAIDEIHQAIDELVQQPIPQEMEHDPSQPQYDPYMMGQNINDQMQYMIDPFMMHGPMPGP